MSKQDFLGCAVLCLCMCVWAGNECLRTAAMGWGRLRKHEEVSEDQTVVL